MLKKIWRKLNKASNSQLYYFVRWSARITIVPLTYLLWLTAPFIKIRIHRGQIQRIGHLCHYFEVLVRTKEIDILDKKTLEIFIVAKNPANKTLYNMWKKHIFFLESNKLDFIYHLISPWLLNRTHFGPKNVQQGGLLPAKATLSFSKEQGIEGRNLSKKIGIEDDDWFVCLHNRSAVYLKTIMNKKNFDGHNLRDCSFDMLYESAKLIETKGGKCIRMSSGDNHKLSNGAPKNIIDYAVSWQTDFMDIYLPSKCKFFLGGPSGLIHVPQIFNIPVGCTNCFPVSTVSIPNNSLFIPKLMWKIEEKRFLSYKEIIDGNLNNFLFSAQYLTHGIEVIENDSDDIRLLAEDMFDLVNNKQLSTKDENKRNDFMNKYFIVNKFTNKYHNYEDLQFSGKISWRFLNKHSYLMND